MENDYPNKIGHNLKTIIIHIVNSPYNFSIRNCPQYSDRVLLRFQSPKRCIIKHLKHTKLYSIEFLRTEMMSDTSNYHREYSPYGSYFLFQFEGSDVISVIKNSIECSFVFLSIFKISRFQVCKKYLIVHNLRNQTVCKN